MSSTGSLVYYLSIFNGLYLVQNAPQGIQGPVGATHRRGCVSLGGQDWGAPGGRASAATPHSGCSQSTSVSQQMVKTLFYLIFNKPSVQPLSHVQLFAIPWTAACQASLSITKSHIIKFMSIKSVMPSNHLILCHRLLLLPSIFPSIRVYSSESRLCIRWPKYSSFSFSISPSNEYSGLISFRIDWFDLLEYRDFQSLFQYHSSKSSILWCSALFIVPTLTSIHNCWKNCFD